MNLLTVKVPEISQCNPGYVKGIPGISMSVPRDETKDAKNETKEH